MKVENLVKNFCEFIKHYEQYSQENGIDDKADLSEKEFLSDKNEFDKAVYYDLKKYFELQYAPWKELPQDRLYDSIVDIFTKNPKEVFRYGRITEMVSDDFTFSAVEQLEKYYQDNGIKKEDIDLIEEVGNYKKKEDLNENIFSKDIISLFDIYLEAERLQKDLTDYYNVKIKETEIEEEIDR